ncbi:MAG: aerobic-type carbon monoxide dehydrogenase small subunit (CoxS/CutS family) [Paracoccaceae bacterium]|jgi:aerobic-type carbon monoxide dehydrogenase small subunit (CoxS/CutS family)
MSGELAYVSFTVNGVAQELHVRPEEMLIDVLRDRMALTGAKLSCDLGACGACTVLLDGRPVSSCATFAWQADGAEVRTVEGLAATDGTLDLVQQAFIENSAFQCGYCTPGMIMLARALLDRDPAPNRDAIRTWMGANICRCTGYEVIIEAVEKAVAMTQEQGK